MNVNDIVAEKIAAAARRAEEAKARRTALNAARQRGLAHRHAQRLRNQANRAEAPEPDDADDVVTELTEAEFHDAAGKALARLGLTYAELEDQARRRNFTSAQAHSLWVTIGGAVRPELLKENDHA